MPNQAFVGRQEILGADEIVGASLKSLATAPLKLVKKAVTLPFDAAEWAMHRSPVPNKSWFIGKDEILGAFVGDEDRTMSEDSRSARDAGRRVASCGYNSHWNFIRGASPSDEKENGLMKGTVRPWSAAESYAYMLWQPETPWAAKCGTEGLKQLKAMGWKPVVSRIEGGKLPYVIFRHPISTDNLIIEVTKTGVSVRFVSKDKQLLAQQDYQLPLKQKISSSLLGEDLDTTSNRRQAKQILTSASESRAISRDALRRAIWLYAGASSTEADRTSVGRKMIALLNERQVRLTN